MAKSPSLLAIWQLISIVSALPTDMQQPLMGGPTNDGDTNSAPSTSIRCQTEVSVTSETYHNVDEIDRSPDFYSEGYSEGVDGNYSVRIKASCVVGDESPQQAEPEPITSSSDQDQAVMTDDSSPDPQQSQSGDISQFGTWSTAYTYTYQQNEEEEEKEEEDTDEPTSSSQGFVRGIFKQTVGSTAIRPDQARNARPSASLKAAEADTLTRQGRGDQARDALQDEACLDQIASLFDSWSAALGGEQRGLDIVNAVLAAGTPVVMDTRERALLHDDMEGPKPTWEDFSADVEEMGRKCSRGVPMIMSG